MGGSLCPAIFLPAIVAHFPFSFLPPPAIKRRMKTLLRPVLLLAFASAFAACESDMPPEPKKDGPLVRGLSGQGTLGPIDRKNDPMIDETTGSVN
jgi:hypothetical protein